MAGSAPPVTTSARWPPRPQKAKGWCCMRRGFRRWSAFHRTWPRHGPSNRKQAEIPASAELVDNPVGTACGFAMHLNRCLMFFTPGVPSEFKVMVEQQILPRLRDRFTLPEPPLCLRLTTFGRSESDLAQSLDHLPLPRACPWAIAPLCRSLNSN